MVWADTASTRTMNTAPKDIPDYRRMTYPEMRALIEWAKAQGLISIRPSMEDVNQPQQKPKRRIEIER